MTAVRLASLGEETALRHLQSLLLRIDTQDLTRCARTTERTLFRMIRLASLRFVSLLLVSWQRTRMPVGLWMSEHAFEVLFVA